MLGRDCGNKKSGPPLKLHFAKAQEITVALLCYKVFSGGFVADDSHRFIEVCEVAGHFVGDMCRVFHWLADFELAVSFVDGVTLQFAEVCVVHVQLRDEGNGVLLCYAHWFKLRCLDFFVHA